MQEFPAIANPVTNFLASDVDDSFALGRLKNALEFAGLDVAVMLPFIKNLRQTRGESKNLKVNGEVELAQKIDKAVPNQKLNSVVRPPKNGDIQGSSTGQIQLPDKVVESISKPVEFALKVMIMPCRNHGIFSDEAIHASKHV